MNDHTPSQPFHRDPPSWATDDDAELPHITPLIIASDQVIEAMGALDRHPDTFVRWPFPDLDALTGPMAPGNVWFVCAASGGGKTTFVASVIDQWQRIGKRVYVMALETRAYEFRTYLACMATGIHPGDALSGQLLTLPNGGALREQLKDALLAQTKPPYVERVMVSGQRAINLAGLQRGLQEAKAFGADVVIVDHIDHIEGGNGSNLYGEAKAVNDGMLRMAQDNNLLLLPTSQLNMTASKGDYLTKFLPPKPEHIAFGSLKQRNATGMVGLFRPVRARRPDEAEDDFLAALKAARAGTGDVAAALEPNTMGVVAMKLRNYGSREGAKAMLAVRHGRVYAIEERDKWQTGPFLRQVI
jgi:hypothetical protein